MLPLRHILFPVDFSDRCRRMLKDVQAMADRYAAEVTVFHTYEWLYGTFPEEQQAAAEASLRGFCGDIFAGHRTRFVVRQSGDGSGRDTGNRILEYAAANGVDLIVMPTHGHRTIPQLLLGSVTAKVLEQAPCAVWTDAHLKHPHGSADGPVICAVELLDDQQEVRLIRTAHDWARDRKCDLVLVHAVSHVAAYVGSGMPFWGNPEGDCRARLQERLDSAGVPATALVDVGDPAKLVEQLAAERHAGLVVIGRGHATRLGANRLGSVAYSIVRHAPCPVLSL